MKFLIIDTYYSKFLNSVYQRHPMLESQSYAEQKAVLIGSAFGTADFYSSNLKKLGHEADDVIANARSLQITWAHENGKICASNIERERTFWSKVRRRLPFKPAAAERLDDCISIVTEQIKRVRPDIVYFQDLSFYPRHLFDEIRQYTRLIVGQIACPLPPEETLHAYDLIITSLPHYVQKFRKIGISAEYVAIGFEPKVLQMLEVQDRKYDCTFVGGISPCHSNALSVLETAARRVNIDFFGYGAETLARTSPILRRHHGEVWGLDMYRVLLQSHITINRHISIAEDYANNMRLYESTGCGALLVTDFKENLNELFALGKEVITYKDADELCEQILYYNAHKDERAKIASAGQKRTLTDHTYLQRMEEIACITGKYLRRRMVGQG